MSIYPTKAPYQGARDPLSVAPNAALLIDFDNVTMGMRSDLSKELKNLLNSDIIKGKVTVQRAYADWRRYPQYIVPLSEASIDLIFAPAYGSNKKNATDIRMAIDGIELVFVRPEIGTFILLTGDSDFSSLVLKLKEYGKYVIGVGIQESSSDILVQNCDEYYSYTNLSGLRKTTDSDHQPIDPWVLVERAVEQMAAKDDVMRSDRLKQVMLELDPGFDEGEYGFSKFSRFLTETSSKGLLRLKKLDNGQYEVAPAGRRSGGRGGEEPPPHASRPPALPAAPDGTRGEERGAKRGEERGEGRGERTKESDAQVAEAPLLRAAYDLLRRALERMSTDGRRAVRDSDVKRKMLEMDAEFDESNLGFSKFSRFLRQAHDHEVIELRKAEGGNFEVALPRTGRAGPEAAAERREAVSAPPPLPLPVSPAAAPQSPESMLTALGRRFGLLSPKPQPPGPRAVPPAFPAPPEAVRITAPPRPERPRPTAPPAAPVRPEVERAAAAVDPQRLGLPTDSDAQVRYLTHRYRGVGKKTAEKLVERFGEDIFTVFQEEPQRVQDVIPSARAETVLEQWKEDYDRRRARIEREGGGGAPSSPGGQEKRRQARRRGAEGGAEVGHVERGEQRPSSRREGGARRPVRERRTGAGRAAEPTTDASAEGASADVEARATEPAPAADKPRKIEPAAEEVAAAEMAEAAAAPVEKAASEGEAAAAGIPGRPDPLGDFEGLEPTPLHGRVSRRRRH